MAADSTTISENINRVNGRIAVAAARAGRKPEEILLVAVSKGVEPERIDQAIEAGLTVFGENYVQEALSKPALVKREVTWHFIGHLQRNKVKSALGAFSLIQSVDNQSLLHEIDRRAKAEGLLTEVLVQVNTSGEESKFGVAPQDAPGFVEAASKLAGVKVMGLMTIGRFEPEPEAAREEFKLLAGIFRGIKERDIAGVEMRWLSMGMTHDFEVAIEEGANLVRVGRGIFGARRA